jgi:hypothetical protein
MRAVGSTCSATVHADAPPVGFALVTRLPAASPATHNDPPTQSRAVSCCTEAYGAPAILTGAENLSVAAPAIPAVARYAIAMAAATAQRRTSLAHDPPSSAHDRSPGPPSVPTRPSSYIY